jgi:hypothetical protein
LCGPPPANGQKQRFPGRFLYNLRRNYDIDPITQRVLWLFSGSMIGYGDSCDLNAESTYQCPFDQLPLEAGPYTRVVADPPYTTGFSQEWTSLPSHVPKPKDVLRVAARSCSVSGLIFILHILVIPAYKEFGVKRIALHPVLCGPNNSIRVLNVFEKL